VSTSESIYEDDDDGYKKKYNEIKVLMQKMQKGFFKEVQAYRNKNISQTLAKDS
jgi:hypothetical protein